MLPMIFLLEPTPYTVYTPNPSLSAINQSPHRRKIGCMEHFKPCYTLIDQLSMQFHALPSEVVIQRRWESRTVAEYHSSHYFLCLVMLKLQILASFIFWYDRRTHALDAPEMAWVAHDTIDRSALPGRHFPLSSLQMPNNPKLRLLCCLSISCTLTNNEWYWFLQSLQGRHYDQYTILGIKRLRDLLYQLVLDHVSRECGRSRTGVKNTVTQMSCGEDYFVLLSWTIGNGYGDYRIYD